MMHFIRPLVIGVVLTGAIASVPAWAETFNMKADLKGAMEVPPTASPATGTLTATYDTVSKTLAWKGTVSGLTGPATAAHFHGPAEPGKNAGVLVAAPGVRTGAFEGTAKLTDTQAGSLTAGQVYFNIHTAANPDGEVRGQVMKTPRSR